MAFKIAERFEVQAPVDRVWKYLIDPASVVQCLPGAELLESQDERNFAGAIKVKVGPMSMSYKGKGTFTEVNDDMHTVRMVGEAREMGGSGSTKVTMVSVVTALASGGSEVAVDAEIHLVGRIVQFGRGMVEEVSHQMFRQFATCMKSRLEVADEPPAATRNTGEGPIESANSTAGPANSTAAPEAKAVNAAPLAFRAMWAIIARFFGRLFGRRSHTAESD